MATPALRRGWIGIDLDGTLAYYDHWLGAQHIGEPIPIMLHFVKDLIAQGNLVKIMTARVCRHGLERDRAIAAIQQWCVKHGLPPLEVTNEKNFDMIRLYDDRAVQVEHNTGRIIGEDRGNI